MRALQLKAMHGLILTAKDEGLYMIWTKTDVPDCPNDNDFEFIAENDEVYNECFDLFCKLIQRGGMRY